MTLRVLPLEPAPALPTPAPSGEPLPRKPTSEPEPALARALGSLATALGELARALGGPATPLGPASALTTPPGGKQAHHGPPDGVVSPDTTIAAAVNELLIAKAGAGRSDAYLRQLRHALHHWGAPRASRALSSVTLAELEAYLANLRGSARTRKGRADYLRTLFRFALRRGMIGRDVSAGLEAVTVPPSAPSLHTPEEVEAVLRAAEAHGSRRLVVNLALRYFAGLRAAEVARLGPEDVDLARGWVTVPAIKAKTRSRRLVRIQPALRSFLEAGPLELPGATMEQSLWELTKARGLRWPRNVARHSWVSYRLAASGSAAETAMEAGHSEVMLFRNYRELTSPEEAAKFWALRASDSPPAL